LGAAATNTGVSTISGDLGAYPTVSATGFPLGTVQGITHTGDASAAAALADIQAAYVNAAARTPGDTFAGDLAGMTFLPGVHFSGGALALSAGGVLTLDAGGDPTAVFIFQIDAALNTAAGSTINLINGAQASNIFWQVNGAAGTGADSSFSGTILAGGAITIGARSELIGRALSLGAITLASNTIRFTRGLSPTIGINGGGTAMTTSTTPTLTGTTTALPGQTITVEIGGQNLVATTQLDGTWTATCGTLLVGIYDVLIRVRDGDGNAATAAQSLTVQ
jgi:hypothetical protein